MAQELARPDDDVGLSDVMLAMDVVDTLRHEQKLVQRALNADAREQELIARVKRAYQAQGIEVSEAMIRDGVAAIQAREYQYEPPPPGFKTRLLTAWVRRRRIGSGLAAVGILAGLIGAGWYGFVVYPEQRARVAMAADLNQSLTVAGADIDSLVQRRQRLQRRLQDVPAIEPRELRNAGDRLERETATALAAAETALADATALRRPATVDAENVSARETELRGSLQRQSRAILAATTALDAAENALDRRARLTALPGTLATLRRQAQALAIPDSVDADIEAVYQRGSSALGRGDTDTADAAVTELENLLERLDSAFDVRIVSRPGVLSGVIREPPNNRTASNYYLVVEAVTADNRRLAQRIRSEEDGSEAVVTRWGIRVDEQVFERIRRDKADDGIIQAADVGRKPRGYVDIQYSIPTRGGLIHEW